MPTKRIWLIDGHNIIFAVPSLQALQVTDRRDEARQALADKLEQFAHARGEKVLIVFDGNELASNPDATGGPMLEITYMRSAEGGADNRIIYEATRRAEQGRPVTVVTNDVSTLAGKLPRGVDHLGVAEFWLKHIEKPPAPGGKRVEGDFTDVESELLAYSAAEEDSAARAAQTTQDPAAPSVAAPSPEQVLREQLRLKRERGRLRQQRRLQKQAKPKRRR
jgi:predicted RNA-binding protein with PIN domain